MALTTPSATSGAWGALSAPSMAATASSPAANFGDIQRLLQPSTGISPETQGMLDIINKQRDYYASLGSSAAQGLALQRGQAGSSTEQFGVQQAINQANLSALNATSGLLGQNMQNNLQTRLALGQLTSDEIASLRNTGVSQQYLQLQQQLGNAGIGLGYQNINAAQQIAQQNARNSLLTSGAQLLMGGGLGFGGGGGGALGNFVGNIGNAFGGGGGGGATAIGGLPGGGGGLGANPLSLYGSGAPGAMGSAGSGAMPLGGGMGLGANLGAGAIGYGLGTQQFGDNKYTNIGSGAGAVGGSLFGPVGTGIGAYAGAGLGKAYSGLNDTAKALVNPFANPSATLNAIGSGVNKTLGIGAGKTADGDYIASRAREMQGYTDQLKQASQDLASGNLSKSDFNTQMNDLLSKSKGITVDLASRGSTYASSINPFWQRLQDMGYVKAQNGKWLDSAGQEIA